MESFFSEREKSLGYLVGVTARLLGGHIGKRFSDNGIELTVEQWALLVRLWNQDGLTQQELATGLVLEKSSVSRLLDRLEKGGWVQREQDAGDGRQKRIRTTAKALAIRDQSMDLVKSVLREAQLDLSPDEQLVLRSLLLRVITTLM
jgi:DNA-binding MarR family transcriptional regulator